MNSIEISFENPLYLLFLLPALAIIFLPFFLIPRKRRYTVKRIVPLVLHVLIATVLVVLLAGFSVVRHIDEQAVVLLMDLSSSTEPVQESMKDHANELLNMIDKTTPVGVVVFGEDQIYCVNLDANDRTLNLQTPGVEATNLEQALLYAESLAPTDKALRIILFTDGKPNEGNAENAAYELANRKIRLDAVYFDTTYLSTEEVQISTFSAPEGVYKGAEATLSAELKSNTDCQGVLELYENNTLILTKEYTIKQGSNMVEMKIVPQSVGLYTYRLALKVPKDTITKNNEMYAGLSVAGESTVLVIADTMKNAEKLEKILSPENKVTAVMCHNAPKTLIELCKYDAVVLSNVYYYALPNGYETMLQEYVGSYGRTLLAVGGKDTFMYGCMENTLLQDMLPVTLSLEGSTVGNSVALMLVLDCSSSMNGDRFVIAKQGAIKCLDAMTDNDYVGVVSFSKESNVDAPLLQADATNKEILTRTISALELGRGTYYTEALTLAKQELEKSDAAIKHILFLSDGQPNDSGYYPVVEEASKQGITVSTIGLGYSSYILSSMANYGAGRYYYVDSADDLPDIMLSETEQAKISSLIVGDFVPVIKEESKLTDALEGQTLPTLGGYLGTVLKDEATAYLTTEKGHPLYSVWKYGFGNVACFTSDLNGTWSDRWMNDSVGKALTLGMIKTTVPEVHRESSLLAEIETYGKSAKISVKTVTAPSDHIVTVNVIRNGVTDVYTLSQVHPGKYEGSMPLKESGVYELHIIESDVNGKLVDELHSSMAVSYSEEYDMFVTVSEQYVHDLCELTEGKLFTDLSELVAVETDAIQIVYNPIIPLSVMLSLWLLADIAVRKIRWKDLKGYYLKWKERRKA